MFIFVCQKIFQMLEISFLKDHKEQAIQQLSLRKQGGFALEIDQVLVLDDQRKEQQTQLSNLQRESKLLAEQIGDLLKKSEKNQAEVLRKNAQDLREKIEVLQKRLTETETEITQVLCQIPNIPDILVPEGKTDADNVSVFEHQLEVKISESALPHWDLVKKADWIDFELGNKITGAGFPVYKRECAKLQRSLVQFFLDRAVEAGYQEIIPPYLVNTASAFGTGQLPDKEGQMYHATLDDLYLIPTSEVPVTNILRDTVLKPEDFPVKYTAFSPCFRREAGSWGAHVRGLNRLHQFEKVEIVQATLPEKSKQAHQEMIEHVKKLLIDLELPFRIVRLCGGDLGFSSSITYDFEVYAAAQKRWLEVSSVSNFLTYQSNRLKFRFKNAEGRNQLAHTLNGSALALPRVLAAILENHQTEEGVNIPKILQSYTGFSMLSFFNRQEKNG